MSPLRRWLGLGSSDEPSQGELSEHTAGSLDRMKPPHARYLSAYAAVLARVAYTDREISSEESDAICRIIESVDEVSRQDARLIVSIATESARRLGDQAGREAAQLLGTFATRAQRVGLLRCLFAVAAAHEGISGVESATIEEIGHELGLDASDLETCRLDVVRPAGH